MIMVYESDVAPRDEEGSSGWIEIGTVKRRAVLECSGVECAIGERGDIAVHPILGIEHDRGDI